MNTPIAMIFTILCLIFVTSLNSQPQYDLRLKYNSISCLSEEIFIDLEIKATSPGSAFGLGIQSYRFNFNLTTVPAINPPVGPPNTNPSDRSVYISQEGVPSGAVTENGVTSTYAAHTLTGSSGNLVSYNVNLQSGPGIMVTFDEWVNVGTLRMDLADPMPPCLNLTWNVSNTLVLTGSFMLAAQGTLNNLTVCGICQNLGYPFWTTETDETCPGNENGKIVFGISIPYSLVDFEYSINGGSTYQSSWIFTGLASNSYQSRVRSLQATEGSQIILDTIVAGQNGTYPVINTNNAGASSLRQLIVNSCPNDTIFFDPGILGDTIRLSGPEISLMHTLSILGPNGNPMHISGELNSRVFQVMPGAQIDLFNLKLMNGHPTDGLLLNQGDLIMKDVELQKNE